MTRRGAGEADARGRRRLGPYEILLDVGRGGMGSIHLARARGDEAGAAGFERLVAIKRAHAFMLTDDAAVDRFLDEARLAARVHHANVVGIHRVGRDEDGPYLVFDYVEGDTLDALSDYAALRRAPLPPPIVLRVIADALAGLHAAHETRDASGRPLGILHRDVAPQNLLVGVDGVTRLADFGIAKDGAAALDGGAVGAPTAGGRVRARADTDNAYLVGRIPFLAPEYLSREPVDRRIDVYALGVTAWFALVGRLPWPDATDVELVRRVVREGVPRLSEVGFEIAPAIEAVIAKACARDPARRYATARAMLADIEELGRHAGWLASHGEVADLVQALAGADLAARRARVAAIPRTDAPAASTGRWAVERGGDPVAPSRWRGVAGALAAALALGAGVLVAPRWLAPRPLASPEPPRASVTAAPRAPATPAASEDAPIAPVPASASASASVAAPPPAPPPAASSSAPPGRPRPTRPRLPPSPIATSNPYR